MYDSESDPDVPTGSISCSRCGEAIAETGYVAAIDRDGAYDLLEATAVCGSCGFNEVGNAGCAPELADVNDGGSDVLLYVRAVADGYDVVAAKR